MLKSPVITSSEGELARSSRRAAYSARKQVMEDEGGRYIVSRMKEKGEVVVVVVKRMARDSKVG
jgi:hypothetical protein